MQMRFRKTPQNKRSTYKYFYANGVVIELRPEDVGEVQIKLLHSLDDAEVHNNLITHSTLTVSSGDKHVNVEVRAEVAKNTRWLLSLDKLTDEDDADFKENRSMLEESARHRKEQSYDSGREILHEAVSYLTPEWQKLFRQFYKEEMTRTAIAKQEGISVEAVRKRLKKLEKMLKDIIFKKILLGG